MTHASAVDSIALADFLSNKHGIKTALLNKKYLYTGIQNNVPVGSELGEHGRRSKAVHELYITEHAACYPELEAKVGSRAIQKKESHNGQYN